MADIWKYLIVAAAAYLLGSFSTGLAVAKAFNGPNLREVGSKNTGASNVLRTMGIKSGLITFFGDYIKAALACGLGWWLCGNVYGAMLGGLMVIIGHNWPVFYGFKGGKGVASSTAVMLVCFWQPGLIGYAIAIAVIAISRYISLGSMLMMISYAVLVSLFWSGGDWIIIAWSILLAVLCLIRHHANIQRLIQGKERKIGHKAGTEAADRQ